MSINRWQVLLAHLFVREGGVRYRLKMKVIIKVKESKGGVYGLYRRKWHS